MAFKMTVTGLVKRIRSGKGSVPCPGSEGERGWVAHKVGGVVIKFHAVSQEFAEKNCVHEVWARIGKMGEPDFKEFRGSAESVAREILGA